MSQICINTKTLVGVLAVAAVALAAAQAPEAIRYYKIESM